MSEDFASIGLQIDTSDANRANGVLDLFGRKVKGAQDSSDRATRGIEKGFKSVHLAVTGALSALVSVGAAFGTIRQFETSMSQVAAVSRATTAELKQMRDVARELGSTTEFTAAQAADGLRFLAMAGFSAAESMQAIPAVLDLATASAMGLAEASDIASNVISGFGLAAADAANVADVLAAASSRANTNVAQLGRAMSTVAPISAALGIDLADTASAIGVLSDAGIQGERAGTALRGVMASLAGPTTQAQAALANYGLTAADVNPETRALSEIFGTLRERGLSTADAMVIFGREAASGALVLTEASERVGAFGEELRNVDGAAKEMASTMRDNLGGDADSAVSAIQGLVIALGDAGLTSVLRFALQAFTDLVRMMTTVAEVFGAAVGYADDLRRAMFNLGTSQDEAEISISAVAQALTAETAALEVLIGSMPNGTQMSREAALAKRDEAEAILAKIEAARAEAVQILKMSEDYKTANRFAETLADQVREIKMAQEDAAMSGAAIPAHLKVASTTLEVMERQLEQARKRVSNLVDESMPLSPEYIAAQEAIEKLDRALEQATGNVVTINDNVEDTGGHLSIAERIAQALSGYLGAGASNAAAGAQNASAFARMLSGAASAASVLFSWISKAVGLLGSLGAGLSSLGGVAGLIGNATSGLGGVLGRILDSDGANTAIERLNRLGSGLSMIFQQAKAAAVAQSAFNDTLDGGGGGGGGGTAQAAQSAVEKLQEQIQQERELIGISDDLKFEIEARQRVEDALAQDKLTWNEQAIQGLTDEIILNRQLREEAEQTSGVLRTVFDGLAKGDLKSIGTGLMDMARNSFSGLLQDSFAKGGKGLKGVWETISGGFTGIGAAFSSAGGGLAGLGSAVAGMLPGIGSALAVVDVVKSFVGTTTKLTNAIEGTLGVMGLLRGTEYDIKQKDNIFGSKTEKNAEEIFGSWAKYIAEDLDQEFRDMVQNTRDGIRSLGLEIDEAFTYDFDVQFDESLPHEQLMERLRAELNKANDELLRTSLAAAGLARDGESGAQTLAILNESLQAVNGSMRLLDQSLLDVSAVGAGAARELVELAGGIDAFTSKTAFVFNNFLSESDRTARGLQIATENMEEFEARAGITLPKTHAEFMALLDAQDLTTEAGRELYAGLLDIADEFVTVNGAVGDLAGAAGSTREQIADMYREILGREPDMDGLNFWVDAVQNADYTIGSVASMMGRSFERLGLNAKTQAEFEKLSYEERDRIFQLRYEADKEAQKAEMELVEAREASVRASEKAARRERQQAEIEAQIQKNEEAFALVADVYAAQILGGVRDMASVLREFPGATKEAIEKAFENIGPVELSNSFNTPALFGGQITTGNQIVADQIAEVNRTYQDIAIGMIEGLGDEFQGLMDGYFDYVAVNEGKVRSAISALEDMGEARQAEIDVLREVLSELGNARTITAGIRSNLIAQKFNILKTALGQLTDELGSSEFEQATSSLSQLSQVLSNLAVSASAFREGDLTQAAQDQANQFDAVQNIVNQAEGFIQAAVVKPIAESLAVAAPELEALAGNLFDDIVALAGGIQEGDSGITAYSDAVTRLSDMFINGGLSVDAYNSAFALFNEQLGQGVNNLKKIADLEASIAEAQNTIDTVSNYNVLHSMGRLYEGGSSEFIDDVREKFENGIYFLNEFGRIAYEVIPGVFSEVSSDAVNKAKIVIDAQDRLAELTAELESFRATVDATGEPVEGLVDAISGLSEEAQNELNRLTETRNRLQAELDGVLPEFELAQLLSDEARAVQIEIRGLEKALEDQAEAAQRAADVQRELESVQKQLFRARAEALGQEALREYELSLLQSEAAKTAQKEIYALTDELNKLAEEAQRAADAANELDGLNANIARLQAEIAGNLPEYEKSLLLSDAARDAYDKIAELTKALEDQAEAAQRAADIAQERLGLETALANLLGDTAFLRKQELSNLDESNRSLQEAIYLIEDENARREQAANSIRERISLLDEERAGYQALVDEARSALVALGALPGELTPLQRFEEANAAYENALGQLSSAIDREKGELENSISGLESEAERLRAALFPDESVDLVDALQVQDVLGDSLALAERLADIARDVLGQNVEIAEQQRKAALAQLQGMLAAGSIDVDNVEEIARRASAFDTSQYATREEMQFDQLLTANTINELSELQAALADEAQAAEELRAEQARRTALDQLAALEAQIVQNETELAALNDLERQFGLLEEELSSGALVDQVTKLKMDADAAANAAVEFYDKQLEDNALLLDGVDAEIDLLNSQLDALVNMQGAIDSLPSILAAAIAAAIPRFGGGGGFDRSAPEPDPVPSSGGGSNANPHVYSTPERQALEDSIYGKNYAEMGALFGDSVPEGFNSYNIAGTQFVESQGARVGNTAEVAAAINAAGNDPVKQALAVLSFGGAETSIFDKFVKEPFGDSRNVPGAGQLLIDSGKQSREWVEKVFDGFDGYPSYAKGTDYHPGGPAYLHQNELINLPRGTSVSTAGEVREMVNEIKALRKSSENMALELRQVRKLAESRTNIAEDKRAEELQAAAEATA